MLECRRRLAFIFQDATKILGSLIELKIRRQIYSFLRFFFLIPSHSKLRALSAISSVFLSCIGLASLASKRMCLDRACYVFYLRNSCRQPYLHVNYSVLSSSSQLETVLV